jgi:hypothetical protein
MITLKDLSLAELKIEALDVEIGLLERALGGESPPFPLSNFTPIRFEYAGNMRPELISKCVTPYFTDDQGAQKPHDFRNASFAIPTPCEYCKVSLVCLSHYFEACDRQGRTR